MDATLYDHLLTACRATNAMEQEKAMRALKEMEENSSVQNVFSVISALAGFVASTAAIDDDIRLLASIFLKNIVLKSWSILDEQGRGAMWRFVHKAFEECDKSSKVAAQTAVLAAKMCRRNWPSELVSKHLFPYLFTLLSDRSDWRRQTQTLRAVHEILVEIGTMILPKSRAAFAALAVDAFPTVLMLWSELSQQLRGVLAGMAHLPAESVHKASWGALVAHLCLLVRVLRLLLLAGYETLRTSIDMSAFFGSFLQSLSTYSDVCGEVLGRASVGRTSDEEDNDDEDEEDEEALARALENPEASSMSLLAIARAIRRLVAEMSPLLAEVVAEHTLLVTPLLPPLLGYAHTQLLASYSSAPSSSLFSPPLVLASVRVLSSVVGCAAYTLTEEVTVRPKDIARRLNSGSKTSPEEDAAAAKSGHLVRQAFFDEARVNSLLALLLRFLLYPSRAELRQWAEEPEEYYVAQQGLIADEDVRTSGEALFLALLDFAPDPVVAHLLSLVRDYERQTALVQAQQVAPEETVLWSNVYLCCGLGVYKLGQPVDATDWFGRAIGPLISSQLSRPVAQRSPPVLLYRSLWLCSCWAHAIDPALMPPILDLFVSILADPDNSDAAVLMQAVDTLTNMLHNDSLGATVLLDRFIRLVEVLCPLTSRLAETDNNAKVINLLSALMVAVGARLRPLLAPLAMHLQTLWLGSEPASPLKLALVQALTNVVRVARESSSDLHSLLIPVLLHSLSGSQDAGFLAEDAINLWLVVIRNAATYSAHLDELFRIGVPSLFVAELVPRVDPDKARIFFLVVESYVIRGGLGFVTSNAHALKLIFDETLCRVPARVATSVVRPVETMLLVCPADAPLFLLRAGVLTSLLRPLAAAVPALAKQFEEFAEVDVALISYLSVVARLIVVAPAVLQQAIATLVGPEEAARLLPGLVRLMIDKFDAVGYSSSGVWRQKLWCIAMLAMYMYPTGDSALLDWLPEVLVVCDTVAAEQREEQGFAQYPLGDSSEDSAADPLAIAFCQVIAGDGVTTVSIRRLVRERMEGLRQALGGAVFDQLMRAVEPAAIQRLTSNDSRPSSPVNGNSSNHSALR